jgi:hypothetical protein
MLEEATGVPIGRGIAPAIYGAMNSGAPTEQAGSPAQVAQSGATPPQQEGAPWWTIFKAGRDIYGQQQQMELQREQLKNLQEERQRRAAGDDFDTLGKIVQADPRYRDALFQHWAKGKSPDGKLTPAMETWRSLFKQVEESDATMMATVFPEIAQGVKSGQIPAQLVQEAMRDPIKGFGMLQQLAGNMARKQQLADLNAEHEEYQGGPQAPSAGMAAGAPQPMPATQPEPVNEADILKRQNALIRSKLSKITDESVLKAANARIDANEKRLDRLTGVTGGFNESVEGPDGNEIKIRYNALGEPVNVLGKARSQWEITDVGGKKVMVEKGPKGRMVELGPSPAGAGGTQAERLGAARIAYQRDPSPENKQALDAAEAGMKASLELAQAGRSSVNVHLPSGEQVKTIAEMEGKVNSIDHLLTRLDAEPKLKEGIGPGKAWLNRKIADYIGQPVEVLGAKFGLNEEQRTFLADLATVSGELRRFQLGAAQTVPELAKTAPSLPEEGNTVEGVMSKLRAYRGWLVRNRKALQGVMEGSGVRAPAVNIPPVPAGGREPTPPKTQEFERGGVKGRVTPVP